MEQPIRWQDVQAEVEEKAALLARFTAGKLTVEFNLKDGTWTLGNVSLVFPRKHHAVTDPARPLSA